jgi:hypothetical protein
VPEAPEAVPEGLVGAARSWIATVLELVGAETRLAVLSLFGMLYLTIIAAAAVVVGWSLFVLIAISLLQDRGIPWQWSAAVIIALHVVAVLACWEIAARLSRNLTLPALRQVLGSASPRGTKQ